MAVCLLGTGEEQNKARTNQYFIELSCHGNKVTLVATRGETLTGSVWRELPSDGHAQAGRAQGGFTLGLSPGDLGGAPSSRQPFLLACIFVKCGLMSA